MDIDGSGNATGPRRLALIELLHERDGRVGRCADVSAWPCTIGRALDNDLVLDDPWIAPRHARLELDAEGRLMLQVLDTDNGVQLGRRRLARGDALPLPDGGAVLQLGATRLRLRLPGEVLAPETPMPGLGPGRRLAPALMLLALLALLLGEQWIGLDPGADYSTWLPLLAGLPMGLAAWCGGWALMSKLFQHRFDFGGHLRIALPWMLAITLVDSLWPQVAAMLAAPRLWHLGPPLQALLAAFMVRAHLMHVLPLHTRAVSAGVAAVALLGGALSLALTWRSTDSLRPAPYMSTLPLPALRIAGTVPPQALVQEMDALADRLARRVQKAKQDDADDGIDADGE